MKGMLRENLRHHGRRYVATGVAVAISMAFIAICLCLTQSLKNTMTSGITDGYAGVAAVVEENTGDGGNGVVSVSTSNGEAGTAPVDLAATAAKLRDELPGATVTPNYTAYLQMQTESGKRATQSVSTPPVSEQAQGMLDIVEGTMPAGPDEIALQKSVADGLEVKVGDTLTATDLFADPAAGSAPVTLTVSGLTKPPAMVGGVNFMTSDGVTTHFPGAMLTDLQVTNGNAEPTVAEQDALAAEAAAALGVTGAEGDPLLVRAAHVVIDKQLAEANMGATMMAAVMLVFPAIAVLVASIVVSTTFQVVLHQRRRELALMRSLGATSKQIRGLIVRESLAIGALASLVGVAVGIAISVVAVRGLDMAPSWGAALKVANPAQMAVVVVLGTLLTLVIGMRPARAIAKTSPMVALMPVDEQGAEARKSHIVRLAVGLGLTAIGAGLAFYGLRSDSDSTQFGATFGGGLVALTGLVLAFWVLLPRITYAVMSPWRGAVARMARANAVRNPERTASTGTAILIGVTLITTMLVGASSLRATVNAELDSRLPFDLQVSANGAPITPAMTGAITKMEGVEAAASTLGTEGTVTQPDGTTSSVRVVGMPDTTEVMRDGTSHAPADGTMLVAAGAADGIEGFGGDAVAGQVVSLCAPNGSCGDFTVQTTDDIEAAGQVTLRDTELAALDAAAPVDSMLLKLSDNADLSVLTTDIQSMDPTLNVAGPAAERQMIMEMINIVLAVVVALLGVSVAVALVGVTNTLSLSVVERTSENGLLRALGLTRRQMGRMLNIEAIGISLAGALVGLVLGFGFGWLGLKALPINFDHVVLTVPWWQILAVVAVSVVAALAASWVPGRRAARTSPVVALAHA